MNIKDIINNKTCYIVSNELKQEILSYMNDTNLIELRPGTYEMQLRFETPEGIWVEHEVKIPVKVSAK